MPGSANDSPKPQDEPDSAYIRVASVSRRFRNITAVSEVSFDLGKGEILGLLGSDGAGKTTLLRMIATMLRPSSGHIRVSGLDAVRQKDRVKAHIGYMPQRFGLYQDLTVAENLDFFMDIFNILGPERARRKDLYLGFSNLLPFQERFAGDLSGGMKQKLGLACVLVHQPDILILDEPTNGVDPVSRREFWDILLKMKSDGMTILVSTAYLDEGQKCDRLILMHNAKILTRGTPSEVQGNFADLEEALIARIGETDKKLTEEGFGG
jgi:ABC-2 type transport system ATP-binding protein